jgi:hypothetical protein
MTVQVGREGPSSGRMAAVCARTSSRGLVRSIGPRLVGIVLVLFLLWYDDALAGGPRVVLLRGLFGVFSTGLDTIASELKAKGIKAEVAGHMHWSTAVAEILRERSAGQTGPLVLVGHSQGANNVIDMARSLKSHNITVDLLVTLAPSSQNPVPTNVTKAINYYQSPGWGEAIVADHGFHGKLINVNLADDPTISHINIDKNAKIQAAIVRDISALVQRPQ